MKKVIAILFVLILIAVSVGITRSVLYPRYGVIRGVEYDYDQYFIEDAAGIMWVKKGVEDLSVGDGVAMLMFNKFTPKNIYDDVIIDVR